MIVSKNQEEMSFHERVVAKEITRDDAWIQEIIRERTEEHKCRMEKIQSDKIFSPEEKAA